MQRIRYCYDNELSKTQCGHTLQIYFSHPRHNQHHTNTPQIQCFPKIPGALGQKLHPRPSSSLKIKHFEVTKCAVKLRGTRCITMMHSDSMLELEQYTLITRQQNQAHNYGIKGKMGSPSVVTRKYNIKCHTGLFFNNMAMFSAHFWGEGSKNTVCGAPSRTLYHGGPKLLQI